MDRPKGEVLVYQTEDGKRKLDVRLEDETVWLTQQLIAELFQTTVPTINMHIRNIFEERKLSREATVKKFLTVRRKGDLDVRRELEFYNLDMIISIGYRVKSLIAARFGIWATQRLKEYIVKDFTMDDERLKFMPKWNMTNMRLAGSSTKSPYANWKRSGNWRMRQKCLLKEKAKSATNKILLKQLYGSY